MQTDKVSEIGSDGLTATQLKSINEGLFMSERVLLREEGLPRRSWFKHQLYAPGFYTGYGVKTLPGVREAIEQDDWKEAQEQIKLLATTFINFGKHLDKIITAGTP